MIGTHLRARIVSASLFALALLAPWARAGDPEIELIIDCSGSMNEDLGGRKRIEIAKEALVAFIDRIPEGTRFGLRAFSHRHGGNSPEEKAKSCTDSELLFPIGAPDREAMKKRVGELRCVGWTPLAYSLEQAGSDFGGTPDTVRTIVLFTDGQETCGGDPAAVAKSLLARGLKTVTNVIGLDVDAVATRQLQEVAAAGGGTYYAASDANNLGLALERAAAPAPEARGKVVFADEFDGDALGEAWERRDPDDNRFLVDGGAAILICRERGVRPEDKSPFAYNALRLTRELPADFEVEVEFEYLPMDSQWVRLDLVQDPETRISAWVDFENKRNLLRFEKVLGGQSNLLATPMKTFPDERRVESIRIRKEGRTWRAFQKIGDREWVLEHKVLKFAPAYVELTAYTNANKDRQEEVHFRRFELRELGKE